MVYDDHINSLLFENIKIRYQPTATNAASNGPQDPKIGCLGRDTAY